MGPMTYFLSCCLACFFSSVDVRLQFWQIGTGIMESDGISRQARLAMGGQSKEGWGYLIWIGYCLYSGELDGAQASCQFEFLILYT
jgi:hypothetical protein